MGAVKSGKGVLVGVLRCGRCGRKLHVRYWGRSGTWARYECKGDYESGGKCCLGFGGGKVDERFSQELLAALSPLGVRASMIALERLSAKDAEVQEALRRQLDQLPYEARRAFEQYNEVDARNRLVAAQLEKRWNAKLEELEQTKAKLAELESQSRELTEEDEARILDLGENFERVWRDEGCPLELKKKIIRKMASRGYGDNEIARVLVNLGRKTAKERGWNERRVKSVRNRQCIAGQKRTRRDPELLTRNEAARRCGVSTVAIERLVRAGTLNRVQVVPWAPWQIRRADLDLEPVREALRRLRETGRLRAGGTIRRGNFRSSRNDNDLP